MMIHNTDKMTYNCDTVTHMKTHDLNDLNTWVGLSRLPMNHSTDTMITNCATVAHRKTHDSGSLVDHIQKFGTS